MSEWRSGYHGEDSMRAKAERMFREESPERNREVPGSYMAKSREKTRFYAKGGHVKGREVKHSMDKSQHDMKIPRVGKTPKLNVENFQEAERMKKGGKARHRAEGGAMADGGSMATYRRGGKSKKHHYADGGFAANLPPQLQAQMQNAMMQAAANGRSDQPTAGTFMPGAGMQKAAFKKGGKVRHKADGGMMQNAYQNNMASNALNSMGSAMKRGGHAHKKRHKAEGGAMAEGGRMATGGAMSAMKKGGHAHKKHHKKDCYAAGGHVRNHYGTYESDMMGEHHGASNHYRDYVADMMGEHGEHGPTTHRHMGRSKGTPFAEGGYAMGGVGKYRHGEATKSGHQIGHAKAKGSPFA